MTNFIKNVDNWWKCSCLHGCAACSRVAVVSRSIHKFVLLSRSDEEATVLYLFQTFHVDSCFAPLAEGVTVLLCKCLSESKLLPKTSHKKNLRWYNSVLRAKVRGHGNGVEGIQCLAQRHFSGMHSVTPDASGVYTEPCPLCNHICAIALYSLWEDGGLQQEQISCRKLLSTNSTSCHSMCSWRLHTLKPPLVLPDFSFFPHSLVFKQG